MMASTAIVYHLIARDSASRAFRNVAGAAGRSESKLSRMGVAAGRAAKFVGFAAASAGAAATVIGVKAAANIEHAQKTLTGLYGSAKDARDIMERLRKTAGKSPIDFKSFTKGAEQLAYMGIKGEEANKILGNIADAVVAVGGSSEDMGRVTSAMLKMQNSGRVYAENLNQISEAGVPVFSGLAKHFDTNIANVREMVESGKVSIEDVMSVVRNATGKTFKDVKRASKGASQTFQSQWKIAKDNIQTALGDAFLPLLKSLNPVLKRLGKVLPGYIDTVSKKLGELDIGPKLRKGARFVSDIFKALASGDVFGNLSKIIDELIDKINQTLRNTDWAKVGETVGVKVAKALTKSEEVVTAITAAMISIVTRVNWQKVSTELIIGLAKGLAKQRMKEVDRQTKAIAKFLVDGFKKLLGIKSPSTVFARIGRDIVRGLIVGINAQTSAAVQRVKDLAKKIRDVFDRAKTWLVSEGRDVVRGLRSGISRGMSGIKSFLRNVVWSPIVKGVKALFGINSPSTVFQGFGRDMIRGLTKGLIRNNPKAFVSRVFGGTSKAAAKALGWLIDRGKIGWKALAKIPMRLWGKFSGFLGGLFGKRGGPGGWKWQMSILRKAFPGLQLISGFRPGARTTSGALSYHARGRAVDLPPSMKVFNWIKSVFGARTKELIFSPAGRRQVHNGRPHMYSGAVRNMHWDHVHWAFAKGGRPPLKKPVLVGERGPEIVQFDRGARIHSNEQSKQLLADGGAREPTVLEIRSSGSRVDDMLLEILRQSIRVRGGNVQVVLGR